MHTNLYGIIGREEKWRIDAQTNLQFLCRQVFRKKVFIENKNKYFSYDVT